MTEKIYVRPGIIETNKAKVDFIFDVLDIDVVTREDLDVKDIHSQLEDENKDADTPS